VAAGLVTALGFSSVLYAAFAKTIESFPRETEPRRMSSTSRWTRVAKGIHD
jgi:hypothetical protein